MVSRFAPGGALAALAGAAMLIAASTSPSSSFTLSSPSIEQPVIGADVQEVYWRHWGGGWGWRRGWGWHRPWGWGWHRPWRPVYHPWRRCWWGPWGYRCHWY